MQTSFEKHLDFSRQTYYQVLNSITRGFSEQSKKEQGQIYFDRVPEKSSEEYKKRWHYIPRNTDDFLRLYLTLFEDKEFQKLLKKREYEFIKFLDAGCGIGIICQLAYFYADLQGMSVQATGLEIDPDLLKTAKSMFIGGAIDFHEQNILTYNSYADFNIIYYYQPIKEAALRQQFEIKIWEEARPGTYFIMPYDQPPFPYENHETRKVDKKLCRQLFSVSTGGYKNYQQVYQKLANPCKRKKRSKQSPATSPSAAI